MTSKIFKNSIVFIGIALLCACSDTSSTKITPELIQSQKQITKVYKKKEIPVTKTIKPKEPVLLLRDSPRVRKALDYYNSKGKTFIEDGLARREKYFDMIQEEIDALDLPEELSNVAFLESRFVEDAKSPSGAVGMWQIMSGTARSLGLKVGFFTDERKDPIKSTKAALKYLKDLHEKHEDWFLAIAAYNAGSGNVDKAIQSCGTKDFFKFENCSGLSEETLNFVSRFVAITAITRRLNYYGY